MPIFLRGAKRTSGATLPRAPYASGQVIFNSIRARLAAGRWSLLRNHQRVILMGLENAQLRTSAR